MEISTVTVSRVFKTYKGQARIAELNSKNPVKRVQGQRDRVSISNEAKTAFNAHMTGQTPRPKAEEVQPQETAEFKPDNFVESAV